jgi:uncharacterized protein
MSTLISRIQTKNLSNYLKSFPIVAVIGARQTGKSTLVKDLLQMKRKYLTFDDTTNILLAEQDAESFLRQDLLITVDEVQKVPALFPAMKKIVDNKKTNGQFLITGSANITMLPKISETLAGRIVFIEMNPLTIMEVLRRDLGHPVLGDIFKAQTAKKCWEILNSIKPTSFSIENYIVKGGLPPAYLEKSDENRQVWFKGYVRTYLERDVRDLSRIQKLYEYQKYLSLLAFRSAQIFNKAEVARDCGIPYTTAGHFFDLLLATFQIFLVEPYFRNIGKRLIKSPKIMWSDTGLAMHLQGLNSWEDACRLGRDSFFIENKIAIELKSYLSIYEPAAKLFFWRSSGGAEIDFLIERGDQLIPVEVKWRSDIRLKDVTGMQVFLQDFKNEARWGIVLYKGSQLLKIKENIFLVPYKYFFA